MTSLAKIESSEELSRFDNTLLPAFEATLLSTHGQDSHWLAVNRAGQATGRISLWCSHTPPHPTQRLGLLGHFAANDPDSASLLLSRALEELSAQGRTLAVGPMDGNTWRRYRFVTERGLEPTFFLEPDNPDEWPRFFETAGFSPLASYYSSINDNLLAPAPQFAEARARLEAEGIQLRQLSLGHFDEELRRIYSVSIASFKNNFLYTPITEEEFLAQYQLVRAHIRPELIWIAECRAEPAGFAFAVPDILQAKRGQAIDTVVLKTLAVVPERRSARLGDVLLESSQQAARTLGYRRVIHALMHESNVSRRISAHYAKPFRRYTLFARSL